MPVKIIFRWLENNDQSQFFTSEAYQKALQSCGTFNLDAERNWIVAEPDDPHSRECINALAHLKTQGDVEILDIKRKPHQST